ncbi:amino acid ABC transporter permease [Paenibacillus puerhi]|uniref:amino acid ABC transporter permease n=1 Tax=Paenibacillus puerhi TaxID=2692622 RepID=UPI00135674C5|nr:amino acid ABC transporter permease [Paenibacillus puerhi]
MILDWSTPLRNWDYFAAGAVMTLWLTFLIYFLSFILGVILAACRFNKQIPPLYAVSTVYVELIRNTPALVQVFLIYFGLPQFGINFTPIQAGIIALTINNSAYMSEIIRAGIQSIHKGQWEASKALGLTYAQTFRSIIFPQAFKHTFPVSANQFIMVIFNTSLLAILDVKELTDRALILNGQTFRTLEIFVFVTGLYYVLYVIVSMISNWMNRRLFLSKNAK